MKKAKAKPVAKRGTRKPPKRVAAKPAAKKKAAPVKSKAAPRKASSPGKAAAPDFASLPPESISVDRRSICLACVLDVFTRHMGLAPKTAYGEIRRHAPLLAEITSEPVRPYFAAADRCPYCDSPARWHATLEVHRIEGGKAADAARRKLIASLPSEKYFVVEEKATQRHALYDWLEKTSTGLDLDRPSWLLTASSHYLGRVKPKTDWEATMKGIHSIRRSRRVEEGWEIETGRLFLAPMLFDELLLVQYLLSRSHRAGGLTLEGRYTWPELFARLRHSGYLRNAGVTASESGEVLEQILAILSGGESAMRYYHVVDRRDYLEKAAQIARYPPWRPRRPVAS